MNSNNLDVSYLLQMKYLVTADFHSNPYHAQHLAEVIEMHEPDVFVYAGDLSPNRYRYPRVQQVIDYLEINFFPYICALTVQQKYVIPGNTDYLPVIQHFSKKYNDSSICQFIQDSQVIFEDHNLLLLSSVSITDHCLKDSEANELFNKHESLQEMDYVFSQDNPFETDELLKVNDCVPYNAGEFRMFNHWNLVPQHLKDKLNFTIYERLNTMFQKCVKTQPCILVSHSPAFNTIQDNISFKRPEHVGSHDIRHFVLENKVKIHISGHIHQSIISSQGQYQETIDDSVFVTIGNTGIDHGHCQQMAYIIFDIIDGEIQNLSRQTIEIQEQFGMTLRRVFD